MSAILNIENYGITNIKEVSALNAEQATSDTNLTLKNTQNVQANDYLLIGRPGGERSEIRLVSSAPSSTEVVIATGLSFPHLRYDPVTVLRSNQIKIYRASNVNGTEPADNTYSALDTVAIDSDNITTTYIDEDGGADYWYKFTYRNQANATESDLADSQAVRGSSSDLYATVSDVRDEAGMQDNRWISDVYISSKLKAAMGTVDSYIGGIYDTPFAAPIPEQIAHITIVLAAGYVLQREYGSTTAGTSKDGNAKVAWAITELEKLRDGKTQLVDGSGDPLTSTEGVTGWPDETTTTTDPEEGGSVRNFRMSDEY